jgi:hypothetical protein
VIPDDVLFPDDVLREHVKWISLDYNIPLRCPVCSIENILGYGRYLDMDSGSFDDSTGLFGRSNLENYGGTVIYLQWGKAGGLATMACGNCIKAGHGGAPPPAQAAPAAPVGGGGGGGGVGLLGPHGRDADGKVLVVGDRVEARYKGKVAREAAAAVAPKGNCVLQ